MTPKSGLGPQISQKVNSAITQSEVWSLIAETKLWTE